MLQNPGTMHLLSNATVGLGTAMPNYKGNLFKMKCVCDLIRKRQSKPKLIETCFASSVAQCFIAELRAFTGQVYEERWGSVAFSMPQVLGVEKGIRHYASYEK